MHGKFRVRCSGAQVPAHGSSIEGARPSCSDFTRSCGTQRLLIDAVDAAEVAAAVAEADAGAAGDGDGKPKPLSEKKAAERRHVTLMDWGEWPAVLVTVGCRRHLLPSQRHSSAHSTPAASDSHVTDSSGVTACDTVEAADGQLVFLRVLALKPCLCTTPVRLRQLTTLELHALYQHYDLKRSLHNVQRQWIFSYTNNRACSAPSQSVGAISWCSVSSRAGVDVGDKPQYDERVRASVQSLLRA